MKKIYFRPDGGLGNRMRSMLSAINFCRDNNLELNIIWVLDGGFNCRFDEIFDVSNFKHIHFHYINNKSINIANNYYFFNCLLKLKCYCVNDNVSDYKQLMELIKKSKKNLYFHSFSIFYKDDGYDMFVPKKIVSEKVNEFYSKILVSNVVGIHIRRTDNEMSVINSPIELFIEKMRNELSNNSNTVFYLATDSVDTRQKLIDIFGNEKILYNSCVTLNRSTKDGIISAMIDLYSLSKTNKIYGSFWSSFSETAAKIGNKNLDILVKK